MGDGLADTHQLAIGADDRRLFGKKFFPAKAEIFELLLKREPRLFVPTQAILDGIAELHQRFFNFLAHLSRRGGPEGCHLAVPASSEVLAKSLEAREFAQGLEMFPGGAVSPCLLWLIR